jgi:hypothetical protein
MTPEHLDDAYSALKSPDVLIRANKAKRIKEGAAQLR